MCTVTQEKCEMEENNILTNLQVDVLDMITKRLSLNDHLGLRTTCRSCRKTISNAIENKNCCHLREMPQVFLQTRNSWFFFSLSKKSVHHHLRTPLSTLTFCIGAVEGWLIMIDYSEKGFGKCFFLNPVTDVRIMIPSKLSFPTYASVRGDRTPRLRKMVASSKPNCDGSSDCYLVGLFDDFCHIAIYKLFDKSWTIVESDKDPRSYFMDMEIIGTKLYVSDASSDSILIYDLKDSINGPPKAKVFVKFPSFISSSDESHYVPFLGKDEALGELYFITMLYDVIGEYEETQHVISDRWKTITEFPQPPQITNFKVFKLDTNMDGIEFKNVQLEDRVVFVSNWNNMVMSRDHKLNFNKDLIKGNSIYFAFYFPCPTNPCSALKLGMICLTDSSIKYFPMDTSKQGDLPLWFIPSLW